MRLRELEIFNALMKARTTIGAAELLAISQPAVSKAVKHLEAQTGLTLFKRVQGRLRPHPRRGRSTRT
jgi:DNA-binding transcriptional LysR family regulator